MKKLFEEFKIGNGDKAEKSKPEWKVITEMLKRTDHHLYSIVSRKMINKLYFKGIEEVKPLFQKLGTVPDDGYSNMSEINRPSKKQILETSYSLGNKVFELASKYISDEDLLNQVQKWINEEKSHFLVKALSNLNSPLNEIADAIRRYYHIHPTSEEDSSPISKGIRVSLIRRLLTDQLQFINIAKEYTSVYDFYILLRNLIFPPESHGSLGGKSSGLFLAHKIIEKHAEYDDSLKGVKIPKTWYLTSDGIINFIYYNNLEEIIEQRYKDIDEIRHEYPHIIQVFKNSHFSPEIMNGLSRALDDFGDKPIIVRSSSLLEDRIGAAFAGKYKSLFLANQGTKEERLEALMDAVGEVYASTFSPDPIGYRVERGLIDFNEEMGIMIQEVVGTRIGNYFFPAFAGVAFSNNEFRWSSRIRREDGLIRLVPGLGTRAVDRIGDDYPVLIAPGQPDLRINLSYHDMMSYSPKNIDLINLDTNTFETIPIKKLVAEVGNSFPMLNEIFSINEEGHIRRPVGLGVDTKRHDVVVTFENVRNNTKIIQRIHTILRVIHEALETPVDIEFACNGEDLYLLQCRPQSSSSDSVSAVIPKDVAKSKVIFNANKFVSNGRVPDINYIVYVDPVNYAKEKDLNKLKNVGRIVGKLNKLLPVKKFILMGPGRWGSRDDIRLGVKVTYSDINNTAMLIEIAKRKDNYVPDLSFGTHFFQDLVEASIRYLPLYPDDEGVVFNESFFESASNTLDRFLPEEVYMNDLIKVINIQEETNGNILRILMNADDDQALAYLTEGRNKAAFNSPNVIKVESGFNEAIRFRLRIVENIASEIDSKRFGVKGLYLFGTTFNGTAVPNSDIDLLVHI